MPEGRTEKNWHDNFKNYMEYIVNHPNYRGIPFERKKTGEISWIATKKSKIGNLRLEWAKKKAAELGYSIEPGVYARIMFELHPTKEKPCQICGRVMSLYYIYLNHYFVEAFKKEFGYSFTELDSIYDVADVLLKNGVSEKDIKKFLVDKVKIDCDIDESLENVIKKCELACRMGKSNMLGPGAMSNFPDRLDGFHTYNRCCRRKEDTGRHKDNMKTYNKDRRAYEYWSDGNIHAANKFMNSKFFKDTSADHIGPLSLGFKHDPLLLQKMSKGDNSSKRDRLLMKDIERIIDIEKQNPGFSAVSWYAEDIWEYIKKIYKHNKSNVDMFRDMLKQNMLNFMEVLWIIKNRCGEKGKEFLTEYLLSPKFEYFLYSYWFDENGRILKRIKRKITDATKKEVDRFIRIAFESIDDFHKKTNRKLKPLFDMEDESFLHEMCMLINRKDYKNAYDNLQKLIKLLQQKIIKNYS